MSENTRALLFAVASPYLSTADSTRSDGSMANRLGLKILAGKWMATFAVCFASVYSTLSGLGTQDILANGCGLQMSRIYTPPVIAQMVDHQAIGYRSYKQLVRKPVCSECSAFPVHHAADTNVSLALIGQVWKRPAFIASDRCEISQILLKAAVFQAFSHASYYSAPIVAAMGTLS